MRKNEGLAASRDKGKKKPVRWNYRVMRARDKFLGSDIGEDRSETYYAIYEVYYEGDKVTNWTEEATGSPFGATMEEMVNDLAWIMTALCKPVLDYETGLEVEPAKLLEDELMKMLTASTPAEGGSS